MERYNVSIKCWEELSKHKVKCKHCGHTIVFTPSNKKNKVICSWCGHYIYKNDKEEFKEILERKIKEYGIEKYSVTSV